MEVCPCFFSLSRSLILETTFRFEKISCFFHPWFLYQMVSFMFSARAQVIWYQQGFKTSLKVNSEQEKNPQEIQVLPHTRAILNEKPCNRGPVLSTRNYRVTDKISRLYYSRQRGV